MDKSKIGIREAIVDHARLISVLAATTFYEAYFEQDDPADIAGYIGASFAPDVIQTQIEDPDSHFFIVFVDGRAAGYAQLVSRSRHLSVDTIKTIELKRIYVMERFWGKGVGNALLSYCEEVALALGNESLWLGVWQENPRARRFYQKNGFVKRGTLTFPYGDKTGINDVLEKNLKSTIIKFKL